MSCPDLLKEVQKRIGEIEPRSSDETAAAEVGGMATAVESEGPRNSDAGALVIQQAYKKLKSHARGGPGEIHTADDRELQGDVFLNSSSRSIATAVSSSRLKLK